MRSTPDACHEARRPEKTTSRRDTRWKSTLKRDVADDAVIECQLLILALAAGINDATTFSDYHVFVSNQTGNTALLAVGALGISKGTVDLPNVAFSLSLFIAGGLIFGQIGDHLGRRCKGWLIATNALQTAIMFAGVALRKWLPESHEGLHAWAVIALLAFASGGQVAMARTVDVPQIPTAMVTSAYIDFLTDPGIFMLHNRPRNRRLLLVVCLILGSFIGASSYALVEPALALLLATICKTVVCFSFLFSRAVDSDEIRDEIEPRGEESDPA